MLLILFRVFLLNDFQMLALDLHPISASYSNFIALLFSLFCSHMYCRVNLTVAVVHGHMQYLIYSITYILLQNLRDYLVGSFYITGEETQSKNMSC